MESVRLEGMSEQSTVMPMRWSLRILILFDSGWLLLLLNAVCVILTTNSAGKDPNLKLLDPLVTWSFYILLSPSAKFFDFIPESSFF